jgi:Na+/H+ antiporter NhaB
MLTVTPESWFTLYLEKFKSASGLARALAPAYILYSFANFPLLFLLYTVKKPGAILLANTIFFLAMTIGCYMLIPSMKLAAIPPVVTGSILAATVILSLYTAYEYQNLKN